MTPQALILLELAGIALDLAGIVDPTPVSDGLGTALNLFRGRWRDAALSAAGLIPYIGDLAKLGKLPRYVQTLRKAIVLAQKDAKLARRVYEFCEEILAMMAKLPWEKLPAAAKGPLMELKTTAEGFVKTYWSRVLSNFPIKRIELVGLGKNRKIREMTDSELKNLFGAAGVREAHNGHVFLRMMERGGELGLDTPQAIANVINQGKRVPGKYPGTVGIECANGRGMLIFNDKGEMITLLIDGR